MDFFQARFREGILGRFDVVTRTFEDWSSKRLTIGRNFWVIASKAISGREAFWRSSD